MSEDVVGQVRMGMSWLGEDVCAGQQVELHYHRRGGVVELVLAGRGLRNVAELADGERGLTALAPFWGS